MMIPQEAWTLGSHVRKPADVTNDRRILDLQAFSHRRLRTEISRHRPRRMSSREITIVIPVRSRGIFRRSAYAQAKALPSRANRAFSEPGYSWMPLWSTPLLRPLVSSPAAPCCSRTMMRRGRRQRRPPSSLAMAHPTTPAPTMQMSCVFMAAASFTHNVCVEESWHER